jgi:hypothetical protein
LKFSKLASRPIKKSKSKLKFGFGIPELFSSWIIDSNLTEKFEEYIPSLKVHPREFTNLYWKNS